MVAKRPNLTAIGSISAAANPINLNWDAIEEAFDNTLSRDGSTPNQMEADFDLNSNDILNAKSVFAEELVLGGITFSPGSVTLPNEIEDPQYFTGDGVTVDFTLASAVGAKGNTQVFIDGVKQFQNTYSVSGTTLTFSEAPPENANIEVLTRKFAQALDVANLVTYNYGATSAIDRSVTSRLQDSVSVMDFGAVRDGVTDDSDAFIAAGATGRNVYVPDGAYKVTKKIPLKRWQYFWNPGNGRSAYLNINTDFNMADEGVFYSPGVIAGTGVLGIGFKFEQDTTETVRANVVQYPPAIYLNDTFRTSLDRIYIEGAYNGIEMRGNCGGAMFGTLEIGALNYAVYAPGESLDFVHIDTLHSYPFGFTGTAMYTDIYSDGNTYALRIGRIDGLDIKSLNTFRGKVQIDADTFGSVASAQLDDRYATWLQANGRISIGSCSGSTSLPDDIKLDIRPNAHLTIGSASFRPNVTVAAATEPFIKNQGDLIITGMQVLRGNTDQVIVSNEGGECTLIAPHFNYGTNTTVTEPRIQSTSGRMTLIAPRFADIGTGSGDVIDIQNDEWHHIDVQSLVGWGYSLPATTVNGYYNVRGRHNRLAVMYGDSLDVEDSGGTVRQVMDVDGAGNVRFRSVLGKIIFTNNDGTVEVLSVDASDNVLARDILPLNNSGFDLGTFATSFGNYHGSFPGPYADDTAASAAGVQVGDVYRVTGGTIAWRQV